jgi:hypothetical protein
MHIHLPKPLHGWREFLGEVGIIFIGVMLAIGSEQTIVALHHRSQVLEMSEKLRAESLENRDGIAFDLTSVRGSMNAIDVELAALNGCRTTVDLARLSPVQRPVFLLATDSAWLGVRDSALLPLMPEGLVANYWKIDTTGLQMAQAYQHVQQAFDEADAAVAAIRSGLSDPRACGDGVKALIRLKSAEHTLWRWGAFYYFGNEKILRGVHLSPDTAKIISRQVDNADK